ncbi:hypothetical protein ACFLY7_00720 [Patescibacteria group bacterium]
MSKNLYKNQKGGLIKFIFLIIVAIIILSYFGFDLRAIVESPRTQANLGYAKEIVMTVWDNYLSEPVLYIWNNLFVDIAWQSFVNGMEQLKSGQNVGVDTSNLIPNLE